MKKLTKQGVRDLNSLPSKPRGIVLTEPPKEALQCKHPHIQSTMYGHCDQCSSCGQLWGWDGKPF